MHSTENYILYMPVIYYRYLACTSQIVIMKILLL